MSGQCVSELGTICTSLECPVHGDWIGRAIARHPDVDVRRVIVGYWLGIEPSAQRLDGLAGALDEVARRQVKADQDRDFHLHETIGHITVSTMWDGVQRPESGSYETCVFGTGAEENPTVHHRTRTGAASFHAQLVAGYIELQRLGVL